MKFLADENIDRPAVYNLRDKGYDIVSVDESSKGVDDGEVIQMAKREGRILITYDRDFSDPSVDKHPGIIRVTSVVKKEKLVEVIEKLSKSFTESDFEDTVVECSPSNF